MERELIITDAHSQNKPAQKLIVKLNGGSPWYGYIWINDVIYTVTEGPRTVKVTKTK